MWLPSAWLAYPSVTFAACLIAAYLCVPDIWSGLTDEQRDKLELGNEAMAALHRLGHGASQEAFVIQCDRSGASSTFAPRRRAVSFQPSAVCRSASMVMFFASSKSSRCCTRSVAMSAWLRSPSTLCLIANSAFL